MKCPHCDYFQGNDWDNDGEYVEGEQGDFWELPVKMERRDPYHRFDIVAARLFACPCCKKTFIS